MSAVLVVGVIFATAFAVGMTLLWALNAPRRIRSPR